MNRFNNIEQKQDNTKVDIKIPILPDNSNIITIGNQRIRRKPQAQLNSKGVDLRTDYQKKQDQIYKENLIQQNQKQKDQENALNTLGAFTTFIIPSTHIGPLFRNNGKSYTDNWLSGEGSGSTVGNVAIDILVPTIIGGAKNLTNVARRFPYKTNTSQLQTNKSVKWPWIKQEYYQFNPEQLLEHKKTFLQQMDSKGFEFAGIKQNPDLADIIQNNFLKSHTAEAIVPKDRSRVSTYLNWMDQNFDISTPRQAGAWPAPMFQKGVMGDYNPSTGKARINIAYPSESEDIFIHELGSHGTDAQVANRVVENYPFELKYSNIIDFLRGDIGKFNKRPTIQNIYRDISNISPGIGKTLKHRLANKNFRLAHGTNLIKYSNRWEEARATLNQVRAEMFKYGNLPNAQKRLEREVDLTPDSEILEMIDDANGYGQDYVRAYTLLPTKKQKQWMQKIRYALKYLPSATPFTFPIIQSTNESTYKK